MTTARIINERDQAVAWARRPRHLWVLADGLHAVFELKTGSVADTISKSYVDQLGGR